jgi:hypothetical protein
VRFDRPRSTSLFRRLRHSLLLLLCAGAGVELSQFASATPGPGGWDNLGTGATATASALNGAVFALTPGSTGVLYAGGAFTDAGGDPTADFLAQWSGGDWSGIATTPLPGAVNAVAYRNGRLYAGGVFTNAGGNPNADFLAVWDGRSWSPFCNATGPAFNGNVYALEIVGTTLYIGGAFSDAAGIASADALVACDLTTGVPSSTVGPNAGIGGPVYALAADTNGRLYAGGAFNDIDGIAAADRVAYYSGGAWHAMGSGAGQGGGAVDSVVRALAANGANVYVGSDALNIAGVAQADHVAKWNGSAWSALGSNTAGTDGYLPATATVDAITTSGARVFVGGTFTNANADPLADHLVEFDGTGWKTIGSNGAGNGALNAGVRALAIFDQQLVAGGGFSNAGGNDLADSIASYPLAGAPGGGTTVTTTTTATATTATTPTTPAPGAPPTARATGTVLVNGRPFVSGTIQYFSTVDVTNGRLLVRADIGNVNVWGNGPPAIFTMLRGGPTIVEFRLTGGDFTVCPKRKKSGVERTTARVVRRLWSDGAGTFRTRGRYSSATVRGTHWVTIDRCDGTQTRVVSGAVRVADIPRRRQVTLRAGQSYLARPR